MEESNEELSVENLNPSLYKSNTLGRDIFPVGPLNFAALFSFMGGRNIISDLYDHRPDILCSPIVKIIILFSILYMNIKHIKLTIILFFIYIIFIDNYVQDACSKEYFENQILKN